MADRDYVLAGAIAAALAAAAGARVLAKRVFERRVLARLPLGRDGVIPGAQSIDLRGANANDPAVLLLHGFGDTPQTLEYLASALHARGWTVRAPLLPGHGRTLPAWARTRAEDWLACAREELGALRRTHRSVALVGLSMGAALATLLAVDPAHDAGREANDIESAGSGSTSLVLLAPFFVLPPWIRCVAAAHPIVAAVLPYCSARGSVSILDPEERSRSLAYGATTPRLVHELGRVARRAWAALPRVTVPTLVVQSHGDNRTTAATAERVLARIPASDKRLVWLDDGAHVITVDHGHAAVSACVGEWLDAHTPSRTRSGVETAARARRARPA